MIQQTKIACRQHKFKLSNSVYEDFLGSFQHLFTHGAGNTAVHWSHKLTKKGKLAKNSDIIIFLLVIHVYIKKIQAYMQLHNGIGNNEEDDHKTSSIVWGESLLVYGKHVSLIQSATAETVQLCNTLTTM